MTKTQSISGIATKVGSIVSVAILGLFYIPNLSLYWFLASLVLFLAFLFTLTLEKDQIQWHHKSTLVAVKAHWKDFKSSPKLVKMTIYESLRYWVEGAGIFMYAALLFTQIKHLSIQEMFWVVAIYQTGLMVGNLVGLKSGLTKKISYTWLLLIKAVILSLMLLVSAWFAVALFVAYEVLESIMRLKFADFLNHTVNGNQNASSLRSLAFFVTGLGRALGMATMGLVATKFGINGLWLFAAFVLFGLGLSRLKVLTRYFKCVD